MNRSTIGLLLGPAAFLLVLLLPQPGGMAIEAWRLAAFWMNLVGVLLITAFVYLWTKLLPAPSGIFNL
jgi:hypothetical protein